MALQLNIDFMKYRHWMTGLSLVVIIASIVLMSVNFLALGLDFTGGTQIEVRYSEPKDLDEVQDLLANSPYADAAVQHFGSREEVLIQVPPLEGEDVNVTGRAVHALLLAGDSEVTLQRIEVVGPQVGDELRDKSGLAMLVSFGVVMLYMSIQFRFKFAVGGVVSLIHDVIITFGFFSLTRLTFDLTALAAVLTIIGYSLNDKIVVYDRIRENVHKMRAASIMEIINVSLNQTLSRTIMTGATVLLVLIALALLGGEMIFSFAIALIVGVLIGTYSSIFTATYMLLVQKLSREDFMDKAEVVDDRP